MHLFGVGDARNRTPKAVERTAPFQFLCMTITILWYALSGHHPDVVAERRARAPWYLSKANPSTADMLAKLRRVIIAAQYEPERLERLQPQKSCRYSTHGPRPGSETPKSSSMWSCALCRVGARRRALCLLFVGLGVGWYP